MAIQDPGGDSSEDCGDDEDAGYHNLYQDPSGIQG